MNDDITRLPANIFHTLNTGQMIELYERFIQNPDSVDAATRSIFEQWQPSGDGSKPDVIDSKKISKGTALEGSYPALDPASLQKVISIVNLAQAIRTYGHLEAHLDPLGYYKPPGDAALVMETYGLTESDLAGMPASLVGGADDGNAQNALEAIRSLREIYTGARGYDYSHIHDPVERDWLRKAAEGGVFRKTISPETSFSLLQRLTQVEAFEQFLHRFFPGKTRFSIEGVDMLIPMLDEVVDDAVQNGICTIIIGMPHRGRLNVLAHILSVPIEQLLMEFKDPPGNSNTMHERGWTGDVKYHRGGRYASPGKDEVKVIIGMPPIPSHLELVNPVVAGMVRSLQSELKRAKIPELYPDASLPVLIHGDAAFPGEGIVPESLNLSRLAGYQVAGSIHIITNNQLGYTTLPDQGRSTLYSSDLAKGFEIPIIHVNADNPQACSEAIRTAFAYRETFHKDFLIDLVGYRRYGHNEGDEPAFTQPSLYERIEQQPSIRKIWAERLASQGIIDPDEPAKQFQDAMQALQEVMKKLPAEIEPAPQQATPSPCTDQDNDTSVKQERLLALADFLLKVPADFNLNIKLARAMERRRKILSAPNTEQIDWSLAEQLAMATILSEGTPIRMTGQDVERGTFSQRHAVFHDTVTRQTYVPLQSLPESKASFEIHNSPLSEAAALAFEYGFNIRNRHCMVIWEAQYGDFINNAQSILDEFILSGPAKWDQHSSITLLLPHGNEGQGPNHSSTRPERFLQMSTGTNFRLVNCTTAAQYFHLLRDQAARIKDACMPLIVLAPKSLLRHPRVASALEQLAEGKWMPVLDDEEASASAARVRRLLICSGKIAIDLLDSQHRGDTPEVAIIRLEQICPFPGEALRNVIEPYKNLDEICWVQEEPENMGAWTYLRHRLSDLLQDRWALQLISRPASSSSSEGSFTMYTINQKRLIDQAFRGEVELIKREA